jgi:hypothetical protein
MISPQIRPVSAKIQSHQRCVVTCDVIMPSRDSKDSRPKIWTDGGQHPPFVPRAFALASVRFARDQLHGLLSRCSDSATGLGSQLAAGRWKLPPERLGHTGRYLPSSHAAATAIRGGAEVLSRAARVVLAEQEPLPAAEPIDMSRWRAPGKEDQVKQDTPAVAAVDSSDLDIAAVRALITAEDKAPSRHEHRRERAATAATPDTYAWRREWLAEKSGLVLGYGLLIVLVPVGIALAAIAHIKGEDLRKVIPEE